MIGYSDNRQSFRQKENQLNKASIANESRREFLYLFSSAQRSTVAKEFLGVVRAGEKDPSRVVDRVLEKTLPSSCCNAKGYIAEAIQQYGKDALAYAEHCLDWERLSVEEKAPVKRQRQEEARKAHYMSQKSITASQILFLRDLGHTGDCPEDRAEASCLIAKLKFQKERV